MASSTIAENLATVRQNICLACERAGRDPKEVTLVAVSKTKPEEMIAEAMDCGQKLFGENKVQELVKKADDLPKTCEFHMIGHLQRNKVHDLIGRTSLIHSVDSFRLAEKIEEEAAKQDIVMPVLLEVNVAGEESKFGFSCDEVVSYAEQIAKELPHVSVRGLMTVAPKVSDPSENRPVFRKLHDLFIDLQNKNIDNSHIQILSMGMTNDYEVAIEEGATMVRIGTGIFGEREYSSKN